MAFKVGDKVTHQTFGLGEIAFGPYRAMFGDDHYLMAAEDGKHYVTDGGGITLAAKFKVGDKARSSRGTEYTIEAGPFMGNGEWYALREDGGRVVSSAGLGTLELVEPADTITVNGTTYDLTARYRDTDDDIWKFARVDGVVRGTYFSRPANEFDDTISRIVGSYGPLTRVND
jgi:hypothetical protein